MEEIEEVTVTELIEMYEKGEIQDHIHPLIIILFLFFYIKYKNYT